MKQYMEVGEVGTYDKKRYKCVEDKDFSGAPNCINCCDIYPGKIGQSLCDVVCCLDFEREDGKNVHFELVGKSKGKED